MAEDLENSNKRPLEEDNSPSVQEDSGTRQHNLSDSMLIITSS